MRANEATAITIILNDNHETSLRLIDSANTM